VVWILGADARAREQNNISANKTLYKFGRNGKWNVVFAVVALTVHADLP
jgi:hypothetical protein